MAWRTVKEVALELGITKGYVRQMTAGDSPVLTTRTRPMPAWPFYYLEIDETSFQRFRKKLNACSDKTKATRVG